MSTLVINLMQETTVYNQIRMLRGYLFNHTTQHITVAEVECIVKCITKGTAHRYLTALIVGMLVPRLHTSWSYHVSSLLKLVSSDSDKIVLLDKLTNVPIVRQLTVYDVHRVLKTFKSKSPALYAYKAVTVWGSVRRMGIRALLEVLGNMDKQFHLTAQEMTDAFNFMDNNDVQYDVPADTVCVFKADHGPRCRKFIQIMSLVLPRWKGDKHWDAFLLANKNPLWDNTNHDCHADVKLIKKALLKFLIESEPDEVEDEEEDYKRDSDDSDSDSDTDDDDNGNKRKRRKQDDCAICRDEKVERVAMPCGHAFACAKCALKLSTKPCSICCQVITQFMPLHLCGVDKDSDTDQHRPPPLEKAENTQPVINESACNSNLPPLVR